MQGGLLRLVWMVALTTVVAGALVAELAAGGSPTTIVELRDTRGHVVGSVKGFSRGPQSSELDAVLRPGTGIDRYESFLLLRRGTCGRQELPALYQGHGSFVIPVTAARLARSSFVVEVTRVGERTPVGCGFHKGAVPFPPSPAAPASRNLRFKHAGADYVAVAPRYGSGKPSTVRVTSARAGTATRVVISANEGGPSGGQFARLVPGTCRKHRTGRAIYLEDVNPFSPSVTTVGVRVAELVSTPFALEVFSGAGPWGDGRGVEACFDL